MKDPDLASLLGKEIQAAKALFPKWTFKETRMAGEDSENLATEFLYASKPNGLRILCDEKKTIRSLFAYGEGVEGFRRYPYAVAGIGLDWTQDQVRALLGKPAWSQEIRKWVLGTLGPSERYDNPVCRLHVQYRAAKSIIETVAVMLPEAGPRV